MRDPLSWALPLGRIFGITIRVHLLFPLVAAGMILRMAFYKDPSGAPVPSGLWIDMTMILALLFFSVVLHEFGHCFAARWMDGDANEVLLWPLGGLAFCEVPHTPRANLVTALGGPAVNVALFLVCGALLAVLHEPTLRPPLHPLYAPFRANSEGEILLDTWSGETKLVSNLGLIVLARLFWVNWALSLVNLVLIGFPMDAGRIFQSILWKYVGYRQATLAAVFAGFVMVILVAIYGIAASEVLALCLAVFIYFSCRHQWVLLETEGADVFGYDFSQGYTSLERDEPPAVPRRKRQGWLQRWLQRRAARKLQREQEQREAEERRMDELLEKVARVGMSGLTEEEQ